MNLKKAVISLLAILIRVMIIVAVLLMIYRVAFQAYDFGYRVFSEPPVSSGDGVEVSVTIPMGSSALDIGEILENRGLIRSKWLFFVQERLSEYHGLLLPGTYTLSSAMTAEEMMAAMAPGTEEATEAP